MAVIASDTDGLTAEQVDAFHEQGFLHIPGVFDPGDVADLRDDLDWLIETWAEKRDSWTGGWRKHYIADEEDAKAVFAGMHDLQLFSAAWARAIVHPRLGAALGALLKSDVEFHHTTMHVKAPETGMPFPMHQDWPFYRHEDGRYIDVLLHLDDTSPANGEIRFLPGSHKDGALPHIDVADGKACTPYLPVEEYRLEDTVAVPARAGDVVVFSIFTVHGSYTNTTDEPRRLVRMGYRDPDNRQLAGQSMGRSGPIVWGRKHRLDVGADGVDAPGWPW